MRSDFFSVQVLFYFIFSRIHFLLRVLYENFTNRTQIIPLMPNGAFNICCPRDCVFRHNGGTSGAPLKPLRVDSALKALSTLRGLRGAPEVAPLCRETQSLGQQMLNAPFGINGLKLHCLTSHPTYLHFLKWRILIFFYNLTKPIKPNPDV